MPRYGIFVLLILHYLHSVNGPQAISNSMNCCYQRNLATLDISYYGVNTNKLGKLWKKTETTSENQNDDEKKRNIPLEEITENVKKAKSTEKERKDRDKSTPIPK